MVIEFLNSVRGDKPMYLEDGDLDQRKKIGPMMMQLLKEGQAIFLIQEDNTRRITGYDEASNQWQVLSDPQLRPERAREPANADQPRTRGGRLTREYVPAYGTRVTAVGRSAGG